MPPIDKDNATPPGIEGGTPMEISMTDDPNFHASVSQRP